MANRVKKFTDQFRDDQSDAGDDENKKKKKRIKKGRGEDNLDPVEELAAQLEYEKQQAEKLAQKKEPADIEQNEMVSTEPLKKATTETTRQISQEVEAVLDLKTNNASEADPIDSAVLEQNTGSIVSLETATREAIAAVAETPSAASPVKNPIIPEEKIDNNIDKEKEEEKKKEIEKELKKIWSGINELYTLINLNEKVADQKLLDEYFNITRNTYDIEYQGLKRMLEAGKIEDIQIEKLKRFLNDVSDDYKRLYNTLEKAGPNFIKPKEASSQTEIDKIKRKRLIEVNLTQINSGLENYLEIINKEIPENYKQDFLNKFNEFKEAYDNFKQANQDDIDLSKLEKLLSQINNELHSYHNLLNNPGKPIFPNPKNSEIVTSEKKQLTFQEWSLSRYNLITSLVEKAPSNLSDKDYDLWYKENVEPKIIDWEEKNPRPFTNTTIINELEDANNNNLVDHNKQERRNPRLITQEPETSTNEAKGITDATNTKNLIADSIPVNQLLENQQSSETPLSPDNIQEPEVASSPEIILKDNKPLEIKKSPDSGMPSEGVLPEIPEVDINNPDNALFSPATEEPFNFESFTEYEAPFDQEWRPKTPAEKNTVIRNIANQGILREQLKQEYPNLTNDQINEIAKNQAEFVKTNLVENLIIKDNNKIKKIFKPESGRLTQKDLKQELLNNLLDKSSLDSQKKLKLLARQISEATGLSMEEVESCIANQEQNLRDQALAEINAGRIAGATAEEVAANAQSGRKKKIGWTLAKLVAYIGGGALLTGATGGVGAITALTGVRIIDRVITDRLQKRKVDAKFAEMKAQLESDPNSQDVFLKGFFAEISVAQQKRISGDHNFNFEGFAEANPDLLAGYEANEQEQIIKALNALQRIDEINYIREHDLIERQIGDRIKKSDNRALKFMEGIAASFNKFMIKGGENTYERAVSAAMLGGAAIAAREMPVIRNLMLAMAGWKAGDFAGRMIWGDKNQELDKVDDRDTAQDILDTLAVMEKNKTSDKHKRLLLKASTSALFALMPTIANQVLDHWPASGAKASGAGAETLIPTETIEAPKVNPLTEAITEMKGVHGNESSHLWGLIDKKVDVMTDHLKGIEDIKELAGSEGRMTHIIDNIKDQIAKNPQDFGLPKGANIDVLTSADLEKISQNEHFNDLIAGMFKEESFADQAQNLSAEAVGNIEANNDYYQAVASHLEGVNLDQEAYNAMDRMHNQGLSAEAAASALQEHQTGITQSVAEQSGVISSQDLADVVSTNTPETSALSTFSENFQNNNTKEAWLKTIESIQGDNKHVAGKSLDAIFRQLGLTENYSDPNTANFIIKNPGYREGILSFEVPAPIDYKLAEQTDAFHFAYDSNKHEMVGYVADETVILKNVKNIDEGLKAVFNNLKEKVTR